MEVRDARADDLTALARLKPGEALHRDRVRDTQDGALRYLVVEDGGSVLGFGVLVLRQPSGWPAVHVLPQALDLFVREDRRSRGLGTFLLGEIEAIAQEADQPALHLCVDPDANPRALALYLRLGYVRLDEQPVEESWTYTDSDGRVHEGSARLVRVRKPLRSTLTALREHAVRLRDGDLTLRPMTEDDWAILLAWNQDPEVLRYAEVDPVEAHTLREIQGIYRSVSRAAKVFVMEHEGRPVGECWLQEMNLPRILARFPWEARLQRIDLMIGEKELWGRGLGTRAIRLLLRHAFEHDRADAVFGCDVVESNPRSARALQRLGFVPVPARDTPKGKAFDFCLTREAWEKSTE